MKGGDFFRLNPGELVKLPSSSELFMLPHRIPVGYDAQKRSFVGLCVNPLKNKAERCFAVAAFLPPGFTITYNSSYREKGRPKLLPLFAYAAVVFYKGSFYTAALRVDMERRQDLRLMDAAAARRNAGLFKKIFPANRLLKHLEGCALRYGCPAAKNFFLKRYEAPLPTSPLCNAVCAGCISRQPRQRCPATQPRIKFIPTPQEVSEIAIFHIHNVKDPIVSFGQGCEGEPLLVPKVLEESVRLIRKQTRKGIINLNTNGSRPSAINRLFDFGLDSVRISLNSAQKIYYDRYYKPKTYTFRDVIASIAAAKRKRGFVSLNYLTMPGFTDLKDEYIAFRNLLSACGPDMIQWRNLNFDPAEYFRELKVTPGNSELLGIRQVIKAVQQAFPAVMTGYFNPSRSRIKRHCQG